MSAPIPLLQQVAQEIMAQAGTNASHLVVILPNKRAGLFLQEYLAAEVKAAHRPLFMPRIIDVDRWINAMWPTTRPSTLELIVELWKVYTEKLGKRDDFAEFYFWGQMMLRDFDEVDKQLVNAERLFTTVKDQQEIDLTFEDVLEPEQREELLRIWGHIRQAKSSEHKELFMAIWQQLPAIYATLHERLRKVGKTTEGLQYRHAYAKIKDWLAAQPPKTQYWFVGLNELSAAEEGIITHLVEQGRARMVWDPAQAWMQNHHWLEAGWHWQKYAKRNPVLADTLPSTEAKEPSQIPAVTSVAFGVPVAQTKQIGVILQNLIREVEDPKQVAILVPDATLLLPLLHSLPTHALNVKGEEVSLEPNVAMGYPFRQTALHSFLYHWVELHLQARTNQSGHVEYYHRNVVPLLQHPLLKVMGRGAATEATAEELKTAAAQAGELLSRIGKENLIYIPSALVSDSASFLQALFRPVNSTEQIFATLHEMLKLLSLDLLNRQTVPVIEDDEESEEAPVVVKRSLQLEYLAQAIKAINQLEHTIKQAGIKLDLKIFWKLLRDLLNEIEMPFAGEPLSGLQVLGLLEARALQFDHVVVLAANEDLLPRRTSKASFIPYNLRRVFGLGTHTEVEAAQAYRLFSVVNRAKSVHMLYTTAGASESISGEPSRYISQMEHGLLWPVNHTGIQVATRTAGALPISIRSTAAVRQALLTRFGQLGTEGKTLDPSAVSTYITCKLQFYLRYIVGAKARNEVQEEQANNTIGNLLHETMDTLYAWLQKHKGISAVEDSDQEWLLANLKKALAYAFASLKLGEDLDRVRGQLAISKEVVLKYANRIIEHDMSMAPFDILALEENTSTVPWKIPVVSDAAQYTMHLGGRIDRIDNAGGSLRVVDYKTGKVELEAKDLNSLFDPTSHTKAKAVYQTLHYAHLLGVREPKLVETMRVQPVVYSTRDAEDDTYDPLKAGLLIIKGEPILHYAHQVEQVFVQAVQDLVQGMFSEDLVFDQIEDEKPCQYCDYRQLCQRALKEED